MSIDINMKEKGSDSDSIDYIVNKMVEEENLYNRRVNSLVLPNHCVMSKPSCVLPA